ncbi:MAG: DUF5666 domain-containing protein [Ktedonobacterales bacterium]
MLKSRTAITVIGVVIIGSASAIGVLLSAAHSGPSIAALGQATATATPSPTPSATVSPTPTPTTLAPRPTRTPSGQIIDLHGTIKSINSDDNQFTYTDTAGKTWTIRVTSNTTYEGVAQTFGGLQAGMRAEVSGVITGTATFRAYHVNTDN